MRNSDARLVHRIRQVLLVGGIGLAAASVQAQTDAQRPAPPEAFNQDILPTGAVPGETSTISSLDMAWMEDTQMNLMRPGLGTTVKNGPSQMVSEDPTMETTLKPGTTSPVIRFKEAQVINKFVFFNFFGSGTISVSGALTDSGAPVWKTLANDVAFTGPGPVTIRLTPAEVRFVRIDFKTPAGASVASLSIYGDMRMSDFITQIDTSPGAKAPVTRISPNEDVDPTKESINVAYSQWGARMIYVSSGDTTPETLRFQNDYNPATVFQFAPTDPKPTEILRLPQVIPLKRVAMLLEAPVGRLDVYLLKDLPDDIAKLTYDANGKPQGEKVPEAQARAALEKLFKERSPKATTFTKKGPNRLNLGFLAADCRYMLLTFTPGATSGGSIASLLETRPAMVASPLANLFLTPFAQTEGVTFTVSEVAAFGSLTIDDLSELPENNPPGTPNPPTPPPPPPNPPKPPTPVSN